MFLKYSAKPSLVKSIKHQRCFHSTTNLNQLISLSENATGSIGFLTLNNPKKRNALSFSMLTELKQQLQNIEKSSNMKVVISILINFILTIYYILKSTGGVFSSGHDLKEISEKNDKQFYKDLFALCTEAMTSIRKLPKPVIASVNGLGNEYYKAYQIFQRSHFVLATAAGCQLVASCDLVIASEKAQFATPGVKIGIPFPNIIRRIILYHTWSSCLQSNEQYKENNGNVINW